MVYQLHGVGKMKRYIALASCLFLSACAHKNALMQSPQANTTESIDQINSELDQALAVETVQSLDVIPTDVMNALTPELLPQTKVMNELRFDIAVKDVPARDFFEELVAGTNLNMLVSPDLNGSISLQLKDVTVDDVLDITHRLYGYEYEKQGRLIHISPAGLTTHIFAINHRILVIIHLLQVLNLQAQVQELLPRIRTIFGNLLIKHSSLLWAVQKVIQSSLRRVREWRLFVQMLRPYHQLKII